MSTSSTSPVAVSDVLTPLDLSADIASIFNLDPHAWAPRTDVYAQALEVAMSTGSSLPSNQAVYAALRRRGFRESKRDGVVGFRGIRPAYSETVVQNHHNTLGNVVNPTPWLVDQPE